ncbi:MAG: DUF2892 domain-containing protein [Syntrophomonadaceae bacterium]|nr:DUF2892 domain-containing protein [Syntrophomonadaceae bacterium]
MVNLSFQRNLGTADRVVRIIAGVILFFTALFYGSALGSVWSLLLGVFGLFMIVEGFIGY